MPLPLQSIQEEEPEWMAFGPTDRFDVIELKGLDEHEKQREGREGYLVSYRISHRFHFPNLCTENSGKKRFLVYF